MTDIFGLNHIQWYSIILIAIGVTLYALADRINYYHRQENITSGWFVDNTASIFVRLLKLVAKLSLIVGIFFLIAEYISHK